VANSGALGFITALRQPTLRISVTKIRVIVDAGIKIVETADLPSPA
jgi:hypothetical protein